MNKEREVSPEYFQRLNEAYKEYYGIPLIFDLQILAKVKEGSWLRLQAEARYNSFMDLLGVPDTD